MPVRPGRLANEEALHRRRPIDEAEAEIAQSPQRRAVVGEQAVQSVHHRGREGAVETTPALVTLKHDRAADIETETRGFDHGLRERRDVAQPDIEPLPRQRMHHMRRVADEHEPVRRKGARDLHVEREGLPGAGKRDVTEPVAEALQEFVAKARFVSRHDGSAFRRVLGPHDGTAVAGQRENGEGSGGKEMLHGSAMMRTRMRDRGHDADLRIGPADAFDAGAVAETRALAVRGDEKTGRDRAPARKRSVDGKRPCGEVRHAVGSIGCDRRLGGDRGGKHAGKRAMLHHEGARAVLLHLVVEAEEMGPERSVERAVGDLDRLDRLH